jgi:HlyD family secretion protein
MNHSRWLRALLVLGLLLSLAGCDLGRTAPPTPLPTASLPALEPGRSSGGVIASGQIVPVQKAALSFATAGRVATVDAALGDEVQAGQALVTLETASQEAQVAQAEAVVQAAQANLDRLRAGARPEQIAAAEQAVATARAQAAQAGAAVASAEFQCAVARSGIEASKAALQSAQAQLRRLESGATAAERAAAEAELKMAEARLRQAQAAYDPVRDRSDVEMLPQAEALEQATIAYEAAQASYQAVLDGATVEDRQVASAQVAAARAQVAVAENQALATCAQVDQATAAAEATKALQAQAEDQVALLRAGATPEEIAAAEAQVAQAGAALLAAQAALDQAVLRAPLSGTITALAIRPGETVVPGQIVLSLADLSSLRAETTDLSERDVSRVAIGQEATVYVEALGAEIEGRVAEIAPQADTVGGDVVYTVAVDLVKQVPGLRWGMSAEVDVSTD